MRAGIKPETVLAAAADIADRGGFQEVTLANVAGQLGIRTPSLYNHIASLQDLRDKLADYASRKLRDALFDAAVGTSGIAAFQAVSAAYVAFVRAHPGLYEAIMRVQDPKPEGFERNSQDILQLFFRLLQPFGLPEDEAVHAVRGLRSLAHGFASLEAMGGFQMPYGKDESLAKAISYYIQGLQRRN